MMKLFKAINLLFFLMLWVWSPMQSWAADAYPPTPNLSHDKTMGSISCANSLCHGAITPWKSSNVLQNEYTTWSRLDKHTQTYRVLLNDQSKRIAQNLGLEKPAHESKICLDCHSHNPPPELRSERFDQSEGVGCEACHGPAGRWIKSHSIEGQTHAKNIANGLYPTDQPVAQAKLCLSCHFGDQTRFVTHRMMAAGHPRISFELTTFSSIEPSHVQIDGDWRQRKGEFNPIKTWAIGQLVASQQLLKTFADPKLGRDGIFPELVVFDCYACHHPMNQEKWTPRLGVGTGRVRLNDSNLLMVRAIVRVLDPVNAPDLSRNIVRLHLAVSGNGDPSGKSPQENALALSLGLEKYLEVIQKQKLDLPEQRLVMNAVIDEAMAGDLSDYAGAEQAYMAIADLSLALSQTGAVKSPNTVNQKLAELRKTLRHDEEYQPKVFAGQLVALRSLFTEGQR
jgi:Cytochrome c554 and c-prime